MALSEIHRKLREDGDKLFSDRTSVESFWDEVALAFYPEMANFRAGLPGGDYAAHLASSYPVIARRTLGDSLSAMLRPVSLDTTSPGVWFSIRTNREKREDQMAKRWLEFATRVQRKAMYDRHTGFVRATKEGDHSFVTFGQAVIRFTLNSKRDGLLYKHCHLKDVVWSENAEGVINHVQYRWRPTATQLAETFRGKVSPKVTEKLKTAPYETVNCRHIVIATENYESRGEGGKKFNTPWVSVWLDVDNEFMMEETGAWSKIYIIPRWATVPGSQYAVSPAVISALPDARLIQSVALTLMESGEKYADPPLVGTEQVIRSDIDTRSGGITWVDMEYDERSGDAVRPLYKPEWSSGLNGAFAMNADIRGMIDKAFYLDSLSLPPATVKDMTAFEVGERISEWLRRAMPLFEPIEFDYNGQICEETFDLLMRNGAFGPIRDIPDSIRGADVSFKFESPLHENADRRKGQKFLEAQAVLAQAATLDPTVIPMLDARSALRDALQGVGVPADWTRDDREMDAINEVQAQAQAAREAAAGVPVVAEAANQLGSAAKNFAAARAA